LQEHVEDAAALIAELELRPCTVVAQSGAGPIALALASQHPELADRLVLAEPGYQVARVAPTAAAARAGAAMGFRWWVRRNPKVAALGYYRWASRYTTGGNAFDGYPAEWRRVALGHAESALREVLQLYRPFPKAREVRAITCPLTLVQADLSEPLFHRTTERVRRLIPGASTIEIRGGGHLMFTDQPEAFAGAIEVALSSTPVSA
jgi:pimeloyl-ACP methyl ester carboxylesterase